MTPVAAIFRAVCRHGLGVAPSELPARERTRQLRSVERILRDYSPAQAMLAIRHGMANVWPYDSGQPWDALALEKHILKALAAAGRASRRNEIPLDAARLPDPDHWEGG